jgi:hypothetical protein
MAWKGRGGQTGRRAGAAPCRLLQVTADRAWAGRRDIDTKQLSGSYPEYDSREISNGYLKDIHKLLDSYWNVFDYRIATV